MKYYCIVLLTILATKFCSAQCTTLGQNPGTAFPVCGTANFIQSSVPVCGGRPIPGPCSADLITDINPYWYKFTCFSTGTLGLEIKPNITSDDYDWQIFDITGRNPSDVYSDASLLVACNWSGEEGTTGTSATAESLIVCGSSPRNPYRPLYSKMPVLQQGHNYLLLISHFSGDSQSGYTLSFNGGTANITDPVEPHLESARAPCDGSVIDIRLNKEMKCNSLSANGSEFTITPAVASVISATGINCNNAFDMDSVRLVLNGPLPPQGYTITISNGSDGNTLVDNCDRTIPVGEKIPVTVYPLIPTPMDSLSALGCAPDELELVFKKMMQCNSIASDGSDFMITGPSAVTIASAKGTCNTNGLTNTISIKLSTPIQTKGNYTIRLKTGSDGNTIINECDMPTPAGATIQFSAKDTVSAVFTATIKFDCKQDIIDFSHDGRNEVNSWQWKFDNNITSTSKDTSIAYNAFGKKNATLIVSNGVCSDTASAVVDLDNTLKASFETSALVCPDDLVPFTDKSIGKISSWSWDFGNANTSSLQVPPKQQYPYTNIPKDYTARLIVKNNINCADTAYQKIKVLGNCYIAVPTAFTPNGDGLNDFLYPTNAYKATKLQFNVFNRLGQLLFTTTDWTNKWDGTFSGKPQDPGTYVWTLEYTNIETGEKKFSKGTTVLIR
ncbi:gliding motility-associated C-terminal domain-containing protein [Ferruginibacter lapsinanis]|uniref:T9SS type B sorting domain-containing protein n=1 Tax=Ferruginibacter lapsinanis TaxID=563172 RepID=UPI001E5002C8|nr:gliding motility-associated C-terminal domain-containing protein [Ferruginibacter lapsinanis]UEG48974.1 gliding motility-associated C-terminal domain-containing protein [Ferruginibacter lapsinanis]